MKRPSFQFYPNRWLGNKKLRRCSREARGLWMDVLCLLHDGDEEHGDEYGVLRWPLADIATTAGCPIKLLRELAEKAVLKGSDAFVAGYTHTPFHGGKYGTPVLLVAGDGGPCWFSSRMVKDEWARKTKGVSTRFSGDQQPTKKTRDQTQSDTMPSEFKRQGTRQGEQLPETMPRQGDESGDGAFAFASSFEVLKGVSHPVGLAPDAATKPAEKVKVNGHHKPSQRTQELNEEARQIIVFLNEKTGKNFTDTASNMRLVVGRLREGFSPLQLKQVVAMKVREWATSTKMVGFLRPQTLFDATNFSSYVGELGKDENAA